MNPPFHPIEIFLQPGDQYFGDRNMRTVLGSCVSMTVWHSYLLLGGMCHYMLPDRGEVCKINAGRMPDGRYADEAIALLLREMDVIGVPHKEYQVKLFGGGNMFPNTLQSSSFQMGTKNIEAARRLVKKHGFTCMTEHVGDTGHRNLIFEVWSGEVWVRHNKVLPSARKQERRKSGVH